MVEVRHLKKEEMEAAIRLSDQTFRDSERTSMGTAFPQIFTPSMLNHSFGAFVDGKLVAFMGLLPAVINLGKAKISVYSLGSVCTAIDYRGQGIASQMLEEISEFLQKTEASLLLVSGDRTLYRKAGCFPFGQLTRFTYKGSSYIPSKDLNISEMETSDLLGMVRVAEKREVAYQQGLLDFSELIEAEAYASNIKLSHKVLVNKSEGLISSFLVVGLPHHSSVNRTAIAIEWAGEVDELESLLAYAVETYQLDEIEVPVPWQDQVLLENLSSLPNQKVKNQGTIKVIDAKCLLQQIYPYVKEKFKGNVRFKTDENGCVEVITPTVTETLSPEELISFLFNVDAIDKSVVKLQQATNNAFPIPFPNTAGLNYL
ncbi:GNAT family N-acetyltransferase [Aquibacillus halophilus]|uniref:GNAT family N-acetyltransferase n=1 Tax=Aquibacillus halophilus TaxID=930132 RepID=A0A6A8D7C2_9BACI|nr:GNAT family N-acetyltransferase [Aquibacillus halophilus]MRH41180.1 GNAT family N-acetyltransferase [Aquibacillus halophilus]